MVFILCICLLRKWLWSPNRGWAVCLGLLSRGPFTVRTSSWDSAGLGTKVILHLKEDQTEYWWERRRKGDCEETSQVRSCPISLFKENKQDKKSVVMRLKKGMRGWEKWMEEEKEEEIVWIKSEIVLVLKEEEEEWRKRGRRKDGERKVTRKVSTLIKRNSRNKPHGEQKCCSH